jgi:hypothetical protein
MNFPLVLKQFLQFYVLHTLPMSDFCIYPHSGIRQRLKGLILVKNPLREPWFKIIPSGGAPLPPSQGHVIRTAINQYPSLWKKSPTRCVFFHKFLLWRQLDLRKGFQGTRHPAAEHPRTRQIYPFLILYPFSNCSDRFYQTIKFTTCPLARRGLSCSPLHLVSEYILVFSPHTRLSVS